MINPIKYQTECGCEFERAELKRLHSQEVVCPEHGGKVISSTRECFFCSSLYKPGERCVCYEIRRKERRIAKDVTNSRGDYCRNLSGCLKLTEKLLCVGCVKYVGIFRRHDPSNLPQFTL